MKGQPTVNVLCDFCEDYEEDIELTTLAGGSYDERGVDRELESNGWKIKGDKDKCPNCVEKEGEE